MEHITTEELKKQITALEMAVRQWPKYKKGIHHTMNELASKKAELRRRDQ